MENAPEFVQTFKTAAEKLAPPRELLFSHGTYQCDVKEGKKTYYPFLQFNAEGRLSDFFCSCKTSEAGHGCAHLAVAYSRIFAGTQEPLHVRFAASFWNRLCEMASLRNGYSTDCLKEKAGKFVCASNVGKELFWIQGTTEETKKRLKQMLTKRVVETEETSIKFSNLSSEEIAEYKAGKGSPAIRYELSFWSDLAKWFLFLSEKPYEMVFDGDPLPNAVLIEFAGLKVWFYIAEAHLAELIPALSTVRSPLQVVDEKETSIEGVTYDPAARKLTIQHRRATASAESSKGVLVGEWTYQKGHGFYRKSDGVMLQSGAIPPDKIGEVLRRFGRTFARYLPVDTEPRAARYELWFDDAHSLHIRLYLETPGDLDAPHTALFAPFVYTPARGFLLLHDLMFDEIHTVIPRADVATFINRHRVWLQGFDGFQTHLGSLEARLTYAVSSEGVLSFDAELSFPQPLDETVDFEEWVYIRGSGFYMKKQNRGRLPLHPGLTLQPQEVSPFIASHKEELEQVHHFFASNQLVAQIGLNLGLTDEGLISVAPRIEYAPDVDAASVQTFGDFLYLEGRGFSEIPRASRLPERFREPVVILAAQEPAFFAYELEPLKGFFLQVDPRLQRPEALRLNIRKIQRDRRKWKGEWLVDVSYESELGSVDPFTIWDAFQARRKHLFSHAGLLFLKEPRFQWLRQLTKRRMDRKKGMIRLNTLEWIRLTVFEEIKEPKGSSPEAEETRRLLEEIQRFEPGRLLDVTQLKAQLRPYQEVGLQWLWFLYCHGLSGLLCDDMGLGKTHQAMALLAAVVHEDEERRNKYLVVCPTSVIYHWQELLKRFLPDLRVSTYYGIERSLQTFASDSDLLLTSYGILRSARQEIAAIGFEVAIFDEIQIAKNASSQTHQALRAMNARMRLGLTGTPIENRIRELKALFDVVLPGYMPTDSAFREVFVQPIEQRRDETAKTLLSKLTRPFIMRRKKSEVLLDLPEKIEEIAYCDLSEEQAALYRETARSLKSTLYPELQDATKPVSYVHVFSALSRLKQICDHPALITGNIKKASESSSGKWDLFAELLHEALGSGQKVVIFSQYLDMLAIIEHYLRKHNIGFATIKGSTRDRSEQLKKFREDPECAVFTASLLAAGVGIDLTVASIVIHYDRWWNPAKENQATDRVHRIGQNRGVQVFKLVTKKTIEEHIHELIEKKKGLLEDIVGQTDADQLNVLSRDEIIKIFETLFKQVE